MSLPQSIMYTIKKESWILAGGRIRLRIANDVQSQVRSHMQVPITFSVSLQAHRQLQDQLKDSLDGQS